MVTKAKTNKVDQKVKVFPVFKVGNIVKWTSHSAGYTKTKTGTIVAVLKPNVDYTYLENVPKTFISDALYEREFGTREVCREYTKNRPTWALEIAFKVMFRPTEGMYRTTSHYLILVDALTDKGKKRIYHPRDGQKFQAVTQN